MDKPSEASAFIAVLLTFFGLSDLTAASLDALPALEYWLANVPVRLTVLFGVTAYSWLFSEYGYLGPTLSASRHLYNSWVFTFAFMELMIWYWVSSSSTIVEHGWSRADVKVYRSSFRSERRGKSLPTRSLRLGRRRRTPIHCESLVWAKQITDSPKRAQKTMSSEAYAVFSRIANGMPIMFARAKAQMAEIVRKHDRKWKLVHNRSVT
jgi:hypothetical protein